MQNGLVETVADDVCLGMMRLGFSMLDTIHPKVTLIIVRFQFSTIFRSAICQDSDDSYML